MNLTELEFYCQEKIKAVPADQRHRAGSLLSCVPERSEWEELQHAVRQSWSSFESGLHLYPHTLLMLYAGLAFHEYVDNTFWPQFWRALGVPPIQSKQNAINECFERAAINVGLPILRRHERHDFVGSAVYFIGVPISLWEGFVGICHWALWKGGWNDLTNEEWSDAVARRSLNRPRLRRFLTDNRETAQSFIGEMLAARKLLSENPGARLQDVSPSIGRSEYFDEVPETAEFLRPANPESLLEDRPRLIWRDDRIAIHLPPVLVEGASWRCEAAQRLASDTADELTVNGNAFQEELIIELNSRQSSQSFRMSGLEPFGLFDLQRGRFANIGRSRLLANEYRLISRTSLEISAKGWNESQMNERVQLEDGTEVFVTALRPMSDRPTLSINGGSNIHFGRREQVNLRVFSGCDDTHIFRFAFTKDEKLLMERMPILVLEIPIGFLPDQEGSLDEEFRVIVNGRQANGKWQFYEDYPGIPKEPELEYSTWRWDEEFPLGNHEIVVDSRRVGRLPFGIKRPSQHVELISPTCDAIWPTLHGEKFWIWVLLSQIQDDAKWQEFWIARQAVAGFRNLRLNQNDWKKLEEYGFIQLRGGFDIQRSCLAIQPVCGDTFVAHYAGLVNRLYGLVREVRPSTQIKPKQEHGFPPYLEIRWPANRRKLIREICQRERIQVKEHSLWTH